MIFVSRRPSFSLDIAEAQPARQHFGGVLPEQGRGLDFGGAVEAHRPGRHLEGAGRVLHGLQDAALVKLGSFINSIVSSTAPAGTPARR